MRDSSAESSELSGQEPTVRVLHVDDDEDFCELTARGLERANGALSVTAETDPERALDRLAQGSFDAVVSGYEMPGTDGLELLEAIRERYGGLPFVLFTASGSERVASEAIAAGVTDYLQKGTEQYAVLANRVRNAVEAARQRTRAEDLERINRLIRRIDRRIARLDAAPEIERAVCETIAAADPYRFAWLGDRDEATDEIRVRATGGDADDYLESTDIRADDTPQGRGPAGRAIRTGEPQVAQDIPTDPSFEPWRAVALAYEFRSVAVLPLRGLESWHGVLAVYADRPNAFDNRELTVLQELAETVAGALEGAAARRRLERRERELERYENIIEASGDPVYVIDSRGRFRFTNDRLTEMTGYDEEELLGEHVSIVLSPEDVEQGEELIQSLLKSDRQRGTYEMTVVTADGERIASENHVSLLPSDGTFRGTVGVVRDITRRKERERELERQNERLDEFASVVSHDLRNPLNVVEGSIDLARSTGDLDELDRAERSLDRMRTLIDDLLMLARKEKEVTAVEPVDVEAVATEAWSVIEAPDATLRIDTEQAIRADENRIQQLLQNLFANAVEHGSTSPASQTRQDAVEHGSTSSRPEADDAVEHGSTGSATPARQDAGDDGAEPRDPTAAEDAGADPAEPSVAATPEDTADDATSSVAHDSRPDQGATVDDPTDGAVTVTVGDLDGGGFFVADDGPGIPPDCHEKVFQRTYSTSQEGTGFGLRIVERIAEAHGWEVEVSSSADGGARFEFSGVETASD